MSKEIDHSANGCQREIYELRRELRNQRQLADEVIAKANTIIEELLTLAVRA